MRHLTIIAFFALALLTSNFARAATVTYDYIATVTGSGVGVSGIIVGDTVTGTLTYSDDYTASTFTTSSSVYDATGAILTMNGVSAGLDRLALSNINSVPDSFNISDSSVGTDYFLLLRGLTTLILDAKVIPLDLDFSLVTESQVAFAFPAGSGFGEGLVTANLTSFSLQAVPLPGAAWLMISGLATLLIGSSRKKSHEMSAT